MKKDYFYMFKPYRKKINISLLVILLFETINLINPIIFREIIDLLIIFNKTYVNKIIILAVLMFAVNIFLSVFYYFKSNYIFDIIYTIEKEIREKIHKKLLTLPISYHEKKNIGGEISKIQTGMDNLIMILYTMILDFLPLCFKILITAGIILYVDLYLGAIFVFFIPVFIYISYFQNKKIGPIREKIHTMDEKSYSKMGECVQNIRTVQSFSQENREIEEFEIMQKSLFKTAKFRLKLFEKHNLKRSMLLNVGRICGVGYGLYLAYFEYISPGTFVMFLTLSETVYMSLYRFSHSINNISDNAEAISRINILLKESMKIPMIARPLKRKLKGTVEFRDVCFSYSSKIPVLKNVSFRLEKEKTLAIVGSSGSGKSTIIKLLYRHFDVNKGAILVDGIDIKFYDLNIYRWQMAVVPQEVEMFNTTISKNISYSNPTACNNEIMNAAKISHVDEFVRKLPKKYETLVGERGLKLSGGQRQRIGIARALVVNPAIIIFDEATSSLDSLSEKGIQKAIKDISGKCTMIIIAHRLSTIKNADNILVLNEGKIAEFGTHKSLIRKKNSLYYGFYKSQK